MEQCFTCDSEYANLRGLKRYHYYDNPSHAPEWWERCPSCDKVFQQLKDARIHHKREHGETIAHTENCEVCGDEFTARPSHDRKVCSKDCQYEKMTKWEELTCPECNKDFKAKPSHNRTYCSRECAGKARRDRVTVDCANCGEPVTKKRQRVERVDTVYCDEDCWKESLPDPSFRDSQAAKKFREAVFERDDYTCQDCDERGGTLNAHHIERVSSAEELAGEVENGVTLCVSCHIERHESAGEHRAVQLLRSKYEMLK